MSEHPDSPATELMQRASAGDRAAAEALLPLVYAQLRASAQKAMAGERAGHTLGATALVHEAYIRLAGERDVPWRGRGHFYAAAAEAMRRVLLDHAKARGRAKRGGGAVRVELDTALLDAGQSETPNNNATDFLALDDAIRRLEERDPRMGQVVRLRFYAGLEIAHVALALGVSERTVKSDWAFAKAWLERELREHAARDSNDARDARKKDASDD